MSYYNLSIKSTKNVILVLVICLYIIIFPIITSAQEFTPPIFVDQIDQIDLSLRDKYTNTNNHPQGHILFHAKPAKHEFDPSLYEETTLSSIFMSLLPSSDQVDTDFISSFSSSKYSSSSSSSSSLHSSSNTHSQGQLSIFDDHDFSWFPITPQGFFWQFLIAPFGTIDLTIISNRPFDAVYTLQTINGHSFQTITSQSNLVTSEYQQRMARNAVTLKYNDDLAAAQQQPSQHQQQQQHPSVSTPLHSNNIPNNNHAIPQRVIDSRTRQLRKYQQEKRQLLGDESTPHHCTLSISLYSYFWPFTRGWVGVRVKPVDNPSSLLSRTVFGTSAVNVNTPVIITYQQLNIVITSFIIVGLATLLFLITPTLIQSHFMHLSLGAGLGSLAFLSIALYIIYRVTPFRKVTIPLSVTLGFFANAHQFLFSCLKRLFIQHLLLMCFITGLGALAGVIITIWFWRFDKQYTQPTTWLVRVILLIIIAAFFQSFILMFIYMSLLILFTWNSNGSSSNTSHTHTTHTTTAHISSFSPLSSSSTSSSAISANSIHSANSINSASSSSFPHPPQPGAVQVLPPFHPGSSSLPMPSSSTTGAISGVSAVSAGSTVKTNTVTLPASGSSASSTIPSGSSLIGKSATASRRVSLAHHTPSRINYATTGSATTPTHALRSTSFGRASTRQIKQTINTKQEQNNDYQKQQATSNFNAFDSDNDNDLENDNDLDTTATSSNYFQRRTSVNPKFGRSLSRTRRQL